MNASRVSEWDLRLWRSRDTAEDTWNKRWWQWNSRGAFASCCALPCVNSLLVPCFEEVNYDKALSKLCVATQELKMSGM